jgi:hypothetical protein
MSLRSLNASSTATVGASLPFLAEVCVEFWNPLEDEVVKAFSVLEI